MEGRMKKCSKCGQENPYSHNFCGNCGIKLHVPVMHDMSGVNSVEIPGDDLGPDGDKAQTMAELPAASDDGNEVVLTDTVHGMPTSD